MKVTLNVSTQLLIVILIATTLIVTGVSNFLLFQTAFVQQESRLQQLAKSQARLMEAVAEFDERYSVYAYQGDAEEATLSQIKQALDNYDGLGETGEFTLAKNQGNYILFLLNHRHAVIGDNSGGLTIDMGSNKAVPMQLALSGKSGTIVALDYRGVEVLAAYEPVNKLEYGIVAKIDLNEIYAPFIRSFIVSLAIGALVISVGALGFYRIMNPLILRITKSESDLRLILNSAEEGIFGVDLQGQCIFANAACLRMLGYTEPEEFLGKQMHELIHHHHVDGSLYDIADCTLMKALEEEQPAVIGDEVYWKKDGSSFFTESRIYPMYERNRCCGGVIMFVDITQSKQAEENKRLAASVYNNVHEGILVTDADAKIVSVNRAFTLITGYSIEEVMGKNPRLLKSGKQGSEFYQQMWGALKQKGVWQGEIWNRNKHGEIYPQWETISVVKAEDGRVLNYVAAFSDITPLKVSHERMEFLAHHDPLTGLPNRLLFNARLDLSIQNARRKGRQVAVLMMDLDGFKAVNDTLGHQAGDQLLQQVSSRLSGQVREEDTVTRLGGDEFALVLYDIGNEYNAESVAVNILENIKRTYYLEDEEVHISCSIGVSMFPEHFHTRESLLKAADKAMYAAKHKGKGCVQSFSLLR
ncbi:MAG: diguanylate cyclase [Neptuniibacter sp.]